MGARKRQRFLPFFFILLFVFFLSFGLGFYLAGKEGEIELPLSPRAWGFFTPKELTVVLMGLDQREGESEEGTRADTIIVGFFNFEKQQANLLSVPRDTYVKVPGHGMTKINHAYAYGGAELLCRTLEGFLGVPLSKYVVVNFKGFEEIVDLLGGVEVEVDKRMYYPEEGIDLYPGKQRLNGKDALGFVRYRNDVMGDISRIERQQRFLEAFVNQLFQGGTVLKLPELLPRLAASVETNFTFTEMLALARLAKNFSSFKLQTALLPGEPETIDGISYWVCKPAEVTRVVAELRS